MLTEGGDSIGTMSGGLAQDDHEQTVPRAELFAVVHLLNCLSMSAGMVIHVYVDNKYVVDTMHCLIAGWRPGPETAHGELWAEAVVHIGLLRDSVKIIKIKSHMELKQALAAGVPEAAWRANQAADSLADGAAKRARYSDGDVALVLGLDQHADLVLERHIAVLEAMLARQEPTVKLVRPRQRPLRERLQEAGKAAGHVLYFQKGKGCRGIGCKSCRLRGRLRSSWRWIRSKCEGPGKAFGHKIREQHGLHICVVCGCWAAAGRITSGGLAKLCRKHATKHGSECIALFLRDPSRPPYSLAEWPDGTPIPSNGPGARKRKEGMGGPCASSACKRPALVQRIPDVILPSADAPPPPPVTEAGRRLAALRARIRSREAGTGV